MFWKLGPLPAEVGAAELEAKLASARFVDPALPVQAGSGALAWTPYDLSWRWGVEDDPGHQGYHGLKESVSDEFIRLGRPKREWTTISREAEPEGTRSIIFGRR